MTNDPVVIVSATRTPMGSFQGAFTNLSAPALGAIAIKAAVERSGIDASLVEEVLMGCVLPAGQGQAPTRQAALLANLPLTAGCTTISKVCGSGMKATMLGHDGLIANSYAVSIAGGMESMTNSPYLLPKARGGFRLGHGQVIDHMFMDGLEDAYSKESRGRLMGTFAEDCAGSYNFSRQAQDDYAIRSTMRAQEASNNGSFDWEIAPVIVLGRKGDVLVSKDEGPFAVNIEKIPELKPAFKKDGSVTAANSSSISDGAAALLLMRESHARKLGLQPLAKIVGHVNNASTPALFPSAPVGAIQKLLTKVGWTSDIVDLYEVNEAFAVVAMAAMHDLKLPAEKVNIHGGACALGHPIGASGARIVVTLLGALKKYGLKRGVATLCIGGGEATALALEMY
ncbi:acetyl-CoA C-acyltransferase [Polynucleobacter asymbioticus]|uniref:Acetyl-CoA acetyltransferase n=1 Tax=Polynucleobacter asymbioticus TaxID=576611 RepID=A0AAC9IUS0_9BURK|nr:acetyl-CoA C-acyltransferase [Polynucleobacter asymbioticus]APB99072.1 acetyl-CoA acetyltransferase [Polynucleobacter asymbioticus]APC01372.1 acetyl-CoA acetyltransferase [Polynucleobacter asymbioticus]